MKQESKLIESKLGLLQYIISVLGKIGMRIINNHFLPRIASSKIYQFVSHGITPEGI